MNNVIQLPVKEKPPEFIQPRDMLTMSDVEIDALIDGVRTRRLNAANIYKETKRLRDRASSEKLLTVFEKKMEKLAKAIEATDKVLTRLEGAANEVRAIRLQLGENPL